MTFFYSGSSVVNTTVVVHQNITYSKILPTITNYVVSSNMSSRSGTPSTTQSLNLMSPGTKSLPTFSSKSTAGSRQQSTLKTSISSKPTSLREASTIQESFSPTHTSFSSSIFPGKLTNTLTPSQTTSPTTTASVCKYPTNRVYVLGLDVKTGMFFMHISLQFRLSKNRGECVSCLFQACCIDSCS